MSGGGAMRLVPRIADFRRLLATRLASQSAEGAFLAMVLQTVVFLPEKQSTLRGFAVATALTLLPFSFLEPFAGVFVDRWHRRRILVVISLLRAAVAMLMIPSLDAVPLVYAGTLVVFSANRLFLATATAVVPRVLAVSDPQSPRGPLLFAANTVTAIVGTVALFGSVLAGGLLTVSIGASALLVAVAVMWIAATLLASTLSSDLSPERRDHAPLRDALRAAATDLGDGFRRIGRTPAALIPILSIAAGQFLQVLVIAVSLVVIRERLDEDLVSFSWLVAAGGAGVLLGFLTVGIVRLRVPNHVLIGLAFALGALALLPPILAFDRATASIAAIALGVSYAWTKVPADTLAQRAVPDRYRGRVFAAMDLGFSTARVLGAVVAVPLVPLLGTRTTLAVVAALFLLWGAVAPLWLKTARADQTHLAQAPERKGRYS